MKRFTLAILTIAVTMLPAVDLLAQEPTILVGARAGMPTKVSIGVGTGKSVGTGRLAFVMFEPGIAGGGVSAGIANLEWRPAVLLRATWLRTWGTPVNADASVNYFGPEVQFMARRGLGLRGGVLFPAGNGHRTVASLGVSFGY